MRELICTSGSIEETKAVGAAIASELRSGDVVVLSGDLGAGKTVLVQGAAAALGITARVTSPSFVLVREYRDGRVPLLHADVYRLGSVQELIDLGYEDVLDPRVASFIEWGDAVEEALPSDRLEVEIRRLEDDRRRVMMHAGGSWAERLDRVAAAIPASVETG